MNVWLNRITPLLFIIGLFSTESWAAERPSCKDHPALSGACSWRWGNYLAASASGGHSGFDSGQFFPGGPDWVIVEQYWGLSDNIENADSAEPLVGEFLVCPLATITDKGRDMVCIEDGKNLTTIKVDDDYDKKLCLIVRKVNPASSYCKNK